jgi:hypothetical protein
VAGAHLQAGSGGWLQAGSGGWLQMAARHCPRRRRRPLSAAAALGGLPLPPVPSPPRRSFTTMGPGQYVAQRLNTHLGARLSCRVPGAPACLR